MSVCGSSFESARHWMICWRMIPERACAKLALMDDPFAPVPKDKACTQVFGGPEVADVTGTFRGKPVNAHFEKGNGCEIARWNRVEFLFPTS